MIYTTDEFQSANINNRGGLEFTMRKNFFSIKVILLGLILISITILLAVAKFNCPEQNTHSAQQSEVNGNRFTSVETENLEGYVVNDRNYSAPDYFNQVIRGLNYGKTVTIEYYSSTTGSNRQADVILPYNYDPAKTYPVLYLLHGLGGNHTVWVELGAKYIVQNLLYENKAPEMIIVCPDVFTDKSGSESGLSFPECTKRYDAFDGDLMYSLMPYVNRNFSTRTDRDSTAIAGLSLGGRESLYIGFKYPENFGYIGAFSAVGNVVKNTGASGYIPQLLDSFIINPAVGNFRTILVNVGTSDNLCKDSCIGYDNELTKAGIDHYFFEMPGGHEGSVWQVGLYNFARRIFR